MFYFKVDYLDFENKRHKESGILAAAGYIEAMKQVVGNYDKLISVYLEEWENFLTEDELIDSLEIADTRV
jgi:hypothetical protein